MSFDFIKSCFYEFLSYFVPQKINYKIQGKCLKCGECCRQIRSRGLKNNTELKFMQFILPHYKRFFITGKDEEDNLILSCKFLTDDGKCSVYNSRPQVCRNYPAKHIPYNAEMIEGCGFKVIKKEFKDYL